MITTFMSQSADHFSSYGLKEEYLSMSQYLKRSKMDTLTVWASEREVVEFEAAQMLQTSIFVNAISGGKHKWLKLAPQN